MREIPDQLGRFAVLDVLGRGGQGTVVYAFDELLQVPVALKVLHEDAAADEALLQRLRREVVLVRRVAHPAVARIHDVLSVDGFTVLVMDLAPGVALSELIRDGSLTPERSVAIIRRAAEGIAAVHKVGVIHRDIKPQNILVDGEQVTLVDFGVATAHDVSPLTATDIVVGTRRYVAPEVWMGVPASVLSDVFSLGVVLYQCLAGRHPYSGQAGADLSFEPPSQLCPEVPVALDAIVARALAPMPRDRFASATALAQALSQAAFPDAQATLVWPPLPPLPVPPPTPSPLPVLAPLVTPAPTSPQPSGSRRRLIAAGLGLVGAAIAAVGLGSRPEPPPFAVVDAGQALGVASVDAGSAENAVVNASDNASDVVDADADADAVVAGGVDAVGVDAGSVATVVSNRWVKERRRRVARLERERRAQGLRAGDVPAFDSLLKGLRQSQNAQRADATESEARAALKSFVPGAQLVDDALVGVNRAFAAAPPARQAQARPVLTQAADAAAGYRYAEALRLVGRARALLAAP